MPRWKWLGNRLLTGDREPRLRRRGSPSTTPATARSRPICCARSRSCATPTTSSSTRRSSPRCSRATRAWSRSRSRRATSARRRASTSRRACATACRRSGVLGALPVDRRRGRWPLLRRRPATWRPGRRTDAQRSRRRGRRGAPRGRARAARRVRRRDAGLLAAPRRASTTTSTRARSPQGHGFSKTLAYGRPTAFRPPGYPYFLAAVYRVFKADRERASSAARARRADRRRPSSGPALVALIGVLARAAVGAGAALVALALGAVYVPLILVGGAVMSEPLFASSCSPRWRRRSPIGARRTATAGRCSRASSGGLADADPRATP